jgi:hypothetical protein
MKRMFNLCLVATLLAFGAACSKKTNSKAKEFVAMENALKEKKAFEEAKQKEAAELKLKQDNAVNLSDVLIDLEHEEDSNVSFYELLLAADMNGSVIGTLSAANSDAPETHDKNAEMSTILAKTKKAPKEICEKILKRLSKKADTDLVNISKNNLQDDVDRVVECRSLNLSSDYIEVSAIKALCVAAQKVPTAKADEAPATTSDAPVAPAAPATSSEAPAVAPAAPAQAPSVAPAAPAAPEAQVNNEAAAKAAQEAKALEDKKLSDEAAAKATKEEEQKKKDAEAQKAQEQNTQVEKIKSLKAQANAKNKEAAELRVKADTYSKKSKKNAIKSAEQLEKEAKALENEATQLESGEKVKKKSWLSKVFSKKESKE